MSTDTFERLIVEPPPEDPRRKFALENGPGVLTSGLAHGLALLLILFGFRNAIVRPGAGNCTPSSSTSCIWAKTTQSPPAPLKSRRYRSNRLSCGAHRRRIVPMLACGQIPSPVVHDDFLNRLNSLSKLRAPETDTQALHGQGETEAPSTSNDSTPGDEATYSLRDYIRAQILRRWSLDLSAAGARTIVVGLHVVMKANGTITSAEIIDKHRYATDAAFRQIAMSARNAILLASPINLPPGHYAPETAMTLSLNPRDVLH